MKILSNSNIIKELIYVEKLFELNNPNLNLYEVV